MAIRVKHAPSAEAIGESAYTIGRGQKARWAIETGLKKRSLDIQGMGVLLRGKAQAAHAEQQKQELGFRREQWEDEPGRQLQKSLQAQERLQENVAYEYTEGQKRERARIIEGLGWIDAEVIAGRLLPEHGEKLAGQMWAKYFGIHPYPNDVGPGIQERFDSGFATDIDGARWRELPNGQWELQGMSYETYVKQYNDIFKTLAATDDLDPTREEINEHIKNLRLGYTEYQALATQTKEEMVRRQEDAAADKQQKEQEMKTKAAVEDLPKMFERLIKGQPRIGRKGTPIEAKLVGGDKVYGEEAYNRVLMEAVGKGERDGIPPDVVKAKFDEWWDEQYDKERGQYMFQKFGNRMDFKGAGREAAPETGKVKMKAPDGKIYEVDRSEVEEAEKHGWATI